MVGVGRSVGKWSLRNHCITRDNLAVLTIPQLLTCRHFPSAGTTDMHNQAQLTSELEGQGGRAGDWQQPEEQGAFKLIHCRSSRDGVQASGSQGR